MRAETLFCSDIYVEGTQYMLNKQVYYMAFLAALNSYTVPKDLDSSWETMFPEILFSLDCIK